MGIVNAIIIAKGKVAPCIATLATMTIVRVLTIVYMDGRRITGLGTRIVLHMVGRGYFLGIPLPADKLMIAFAVRYFILKTTQLCCRTGSIGANEKEDA